MYFEKKYLDANRLLDCTQSMLADMAKECDVSDLEKYYAVESKLLLADPDSKVLMGDVFDRLIGSLQNRTMLPNVIKYWKIKESAFDLYGEVLLGNDVAQVAATYESGEALYREILIRWPRTGEKMLADQPTRLWGTWCNGVLSAARFLAQFASVDDMRGVFGTLYANPWTKAALPALLAMEVDGMQFTLACDFLKECGYDYPKPDVHITEVFKYACGSDVPVQIYRSILAYASQLSARLSAPGGNSAYKLDKMLWLVCSGNFYLDKKSTNGRREKLVAELYG